MAHILIVDDEPEIRAFIAAALDWAGHTFSEAGDGREAARKIQAAPFDLIITDIIMPERDGLEMIMDLRREGNVMPVIAMTGMPIDSLLYLKAAQQLGASRALTKPFTVQELLKAVNEVLAQSRAK
jgi:DNA-binding response OmpR family regulator